MFRSRSCGAVVAGLAALFIGSWGCASTKTLAWDFDEADPGALPAGWSARETRPSVKLAQWRVTADPSAPSGPHVLALIETTNERPTFNLAVADETQLRNLDLTVRVKGVTGEIDQGGGPIWRCRDENNYYICRLNPLEANYRVYKVIEGKRTQRASADVDLEAGRWYTVRVTMVEDRITCCLDGEKLLEAADGTLTEAGKVGLWTKADAVTSFDDLSAEPLP